MKSLPFAAAIVLLGFALRMAPWGQHRFLEDEALYAFWGLQIATGSDPLLAREPVDKPPLHLYTLALAFRLFAWPPAGADPAPGTAGIGPDAGIGSRVEPDGWRQLESAARTVSLFASTAGLAIACALGRELFRSARVGLTAALLLALSPFDILFASTAFTDPLMVMFCLLALLAAARHRMGLAGMLSGLAFATKQQGLLFLPLVLLVGVMPRKPRSSGWRTALRFVASFAAVSALVWVWDLARAWRPGFWEQGLMSYGGLRLAGPAYLWERALGWLRLLGCFWASPALYVLLLGALLFLISAAWRNARRPNVFTPGSETTLRVRGGLAPPQATSAVLLLFVLLFLAAHWLISFQVWDRYLLGLVPLLALLVSAALVFAGQRLAGRLWDRASATLVLAAVILTALAAPALHAARAGFPVGGDHGAYDGMEDLARFVRVYVPPGSVLYDHDLGYHYRFYLYGAPLRIHWYPDLADLAADATVYRREPRYIAFPTWRDSGPEQRALARAGILLATVLETTRTDGTRSFRLCRMSGP